MASGVDREPRRSRGRAQVRVIIRGLERRVRSSTSEKSLAISSLRPLRPLQFNVIELTRAPSARNLRQSVRAQRQMARRSHDDDHYRGARRGGPRVDRAARGSPADRCAGASRDRVLHAADARSRRRARSPCRRWDDARRLRGGQRLPHVGAERAARARRVADAGDVEDGRPGTAYRAGESARDLLQRRGHGRLHPRRAAARARRPGSAAGRRVLCARPEAAAASALRAAPVLPELSPRLQHAPRAGDGGAQRLHGARRPAAFAVRELRSRSSDAVPAALGWMVRHRHARLDAAHGERDRHEHRAARHDDLRAHAQSRLARRPVRRARLCLRAQRHRGADGLSASGPHDEPDHARRLGGADRRARGPARSDWRSVARRRQRAGRLSAVRRRGAADRRDQGDGRFCREVCRAGPRRQPGPIAPPARPRTPPAAVSLQLHDLLGGLRRVADRSAPGRLRPHVGHLSRDATRARSTRGCPKPTAARSSRSCARRCTICRN